MRRARAPFEVADLGKRIRGAVWFVCVVSGVGACAALQGLDQYENCADPNCSPPPVDEAGTDVRQDSFTLGDAPLDNAPPPVDAQADADADARADADAEAGCSNTQTDPSNCGVCGKVCPAAFGCTAGSCTCGFTTCGVAPAQYCSNTQTDPSNCGGCAAPCALAHAVAGCASGLCAVNTCSASFVDCNGVAADGCECASDSCVAGAFCAKRVFVTSQTWDGNLGGLAGADAKCQTLAGAAGLPGAYKAWLSDSVASPSTRFAQSAIPYRLVDGTLIANNWADLIKGSITNPISKTEAGLGGPTSTFCGAGLITAWSSTNSAGVFSGTANPCANWTDATAAGGAQWGQGTTTTSSWAQFCYGGSCAGPTFLAPLYCFQQ